MKRLSILFLMFLFSSCATIKTASYKLDKSEPFSDKKTIRIVQISDFHSNDFGKNESRLIEKVRAASPDIIFLTGDIFDFDMNTVSSLGGISAGENLNGLTIKEIIKGNQGCRRIN